MLWIVGKIAMMAKSHIRKDDENDKRRTSTGNSQGAYQYRC